MVSRIFCDYEFTIFSRNCFCLFIINYQSLVNYLCTVNVNNNIHVHRFVVTEFVKPSDEFGRCRGKKINLSKNRKYLLNSVFWKNSEQGNLLLTFKSANILILRKVIKFRKFNSPALFWQNFVLLVCVDVADLSKLIPGFFLSNFSPPVFSIFSLLVTGFFL